MHGAYSWHTKYGNVSTCCQGNENSLSRDDSCMNATEPGQKTCENSVLRKRAKSAVQLKMKGLSPSFAKSIPENVPKGNTGEMGNPHGKWSSKASKLETTIWAIRILLICLGLGSCVALLKVAVIPYTSSFVVDTIPCIWNSGRVLFSPPYIYIIVNCIIIAIAASTSFHHQNNLCRKADMTPPSLYSQRSQVLEMQFANKGGGKVEETAEVIKQMITDSGISPNTSEARIGCNASNLPDNPSNTSGATHRDRTMAEESFETFPESENVKLPETSAAEVEEGDNTLDSIWTEITEGHGKQPRPRLKKSDTWDTATRQAPKEAEPGGGGGKTFTKSETFWERTTAGTATVEGIVVKEKSMGQDELKLRIEAFIRKNHDYLRLQREESHLRFVEAVNSGIIRG